MLEQELPGGGHAWGSRLQLLNLMKHNLGIGFPVLMVIGLIIMYLP